ncbi:unnamed protein product [Pedinophyceae sp. YPF-701]|nr:unnamed protein product [Pedinophyceae sp. YPF-701]
MHVLDRLAAPRAAAAKRPPRAGVGSRRGRAVARAAKPSGPAPAGAPADSEVKAEGADGWVCSGDACERDGTVVSRAALAADAGSEFEVCLPEDLEAAPGELTEIERSAPYLERDAFRCVGCVRPECQTPAGCATMPWRTADAGYLRAVLTSKVYDVAVEAPLEEAKRLSEATGNRVFLKREDLQPVFSFKLRGAYNKIASLTDEELARGVICSSAGNHAQGVALGASRRGARAIICMPTTTPAIKIESVKRLGGEVVLEGETYSDTQTYAQERATREGLTFVAPYDDPCVIAGQGTIGAEILRQVDSRGVDTIFVAIGGGVSRRGSRRTSRRCSRTCA